MCSASIPITVTPCMAKGVPIGVAPTVGRLPRNVVRLPLLRFTLVRRGIW